MGRGATRSAHSNKRKVRILVADREGVFRLGIKKLFAVEDDLRVVAQAQSPEQVKSTTHAFKPDLVYLQADILEHNKGDLLATLRRLSPLTRIIVTASDFSNEQASRYVKSGASGLVLKSDPPEAFVKSARKVMKQETWLPKPRFEAALEGTPGNPKSPLRPAETLTHREKTVLAFLMQGCRNRDIARYLSITEQTVKNHLRAIYDKIGVSDRLELVLYAIHQRVQLPPVELAVAQSAG